MSDAQGTLLLVDDNEMNRDVLSRRLKRHGYEVVLAESGREALDLIASQRFDLALFDVMMPEVSGLEALAIVRKTYSLADFPVIVVTAKSESEDVVEALRLGANDYVTKPVDFPVLLARIATHLRLRHLSNLKDEFLRMASHDLKNPLTEVLGVASLVESQVPPATPMPAAMHQLVVGMKKSARRMQHIIEDFLDFQALEDGQLALTLAPVELGAIAREMVAANQPYAASKGIQLVLAGDGAESMVVADARRIGQVVQNMVDNALKFTPAGGQVHVSVGPEADGHMRLVVQDSGKGLAEADFAKVFRKYARLSSVPTGGEKSSGLGLSICKQLIEQHAGGAIGVHNHPEGGAIFWFSLPVAGVSVGVAGAERPSVEAGS